MNKELLKKKNLKTKCRRGGSRLRPQRSNTDRLLVHAGTILESQSPPGKEQKKLL